MWLVLAPCPYLLALISKWRRLTANTCSLPEAFFFLLAMETPLAPAHGKLEVLKREGVCLDTTLGPWQGRKRGEMDW